MAQIDGYLKRAQLEQVNGSTFLVDPAQALPARVVADIDDTGDIKPYFHNGTDWKEIALKQSADGVISTNSGKACTIDWSTGLVQRVVLTDNALISFSNPQEGETHRLIVAQNQTPVASNYGNVYSYALDMIDQDCGQFSYQPEAPIPFAQERQIVWLYKSSSRVAYANVPSTSWDAGIVGGVAHQMCSFNADGSMLVVSRGTTPFHDYLRVGKTNVSAWSPIRASLNSPVTPLAAAGAVLAVKYHQTGDYVFTASSTSPYIEGYPILDRNVPITAKYANPVTLPAGAATSLDVHPNGQYVGVGHATTPFMSIYGFTGLAISAKLANPLSLPAAQVNVLAFNPVGGYLAAVSGLGPYIQTWTFTDAGGVGTIGAVSANPSTLPVGAAATLGTRSMCWRPQGDFIALAVGNTAPYLYIVPFNRSTGSYGTPITIANGLVAQEIRAINWSPDGQYLIVGTTTAGSTSIYMFDFSTIATGASTALGSPITWDSTQPIVAVNDIVVHPSGEYFVAIFNASPWATVYRLPNKVRNYVRLS